MKNYRKWMLSAAVCMLCIGTTGCGKMSAEKLLANMNKATAGQQITYAELSEDLEASYQMDLMGADMDMQMAMSLDMKEYVNADPLKGYMDGTVHMTMMGQNLESDMQIYMGEEDGSVNAYVYTGLNDDWSYMNMDLDLEEYKQIIGQNTVTSLFAAGEGSSFTLDEETTKLDKAETYVLRGSFMGEAVEELLSGAGISVFMGEENALDLSLEDLSVPMVCYVDTKTYLPVRIEMDIEGMDSMVEQMLEKELGQLEADMDDLNVDISVGTCHVIMKNFSYDPQDIPEVPDEAKEAVAFKEALASASSPLPDGSYIIKSGSVALKVPVPEGYTVQEEGEEAVSFAGPENLSIVNYALVPELYGENSMTAMLDSYRTFFLSLGVELPEPEPQTIPAPIGASDGYQIVGDGLGLYYTTVPLKGMDLLVLAVDLGGNWRQATDALVPALAGVQQLTYGDLK